MFAITEKQIQELRDSFSPDQPTDLAIGYQLGLTVARILLQEHGGFLLARKLRDLKPGPDWFNQTAALVTEEFQGAL